MHGSAVEAALSFLEVYGPFSSADVLEVGSRNVTGSLRDAVVHEGRWVGVDIEPGPGVDVVLSDPYSLPFEDGEFGAAIATSVFEHNEMFWLTFLEMARVVRPGGLLYLCSPSNGHIHRHPVDCYRFYPDAGVALANWACRSGYPMTTLESFIVRQKASEWNDWCSVFFRGESQSAPVVPTSLGVVLDTYAVGAGTDSGPVPKTQATEDQWNLHVMRSELEVLRRPFRRFLPLRRHYR